MAILSDGIFYLLAGGFFKIDKKFCTINSGLGFVS